MVPPGRRAGTPTRPRLAARFSASFPAEATVTRRLPRSSRDRPRDARIASASSSTRTRALNGEAPVARPSMSAARTPDRADRKLVTGTIATSVSARTATGSADAGGAGSSSGGGSVGLAAPGLGASAGAVGPPATADAPGLASLATGPDASAPVPPPDTPDRIPPPNPSPTSSTSATTPSAARTAGQREPPRPDPAGPRRGRVPETPGAHRCAGSPGAGRSWGSRTLTGRDCMRRRKNRSRGRAMGSPRGALGTRSDVGGSGP